mgnify:CR=1 FL=1
MNDDTHSHADDAQAAHLAERRARVRASLRPSVRRAISCDLSAALAREIRAGEFALIIELLGEIASRRAHIVHEPGWHAIADACWDRLADADDAAAAKESP